MSSVFHVDPAASERGLCDIVSENWEVQAWRKYTDNLAFSI